MVRTRGRPRLPPLSTSERKALVDWCRERRLYAYVRALTDSKATNRQRRERDHEIRKRILRELVHEGSDYPEWMGHYDFTVQVEKPARLTNTV